MVNKFLDDYYSNYDEEGRLLCRHGSVEFLTTTRYIDQYLKEGMKILEVGAGTGRYSLHYAKNGYPVEAIELIEHNIECFKNSISADMNINIHQGNTCDLSIYEDNSFDITLVLGPLYHLFNINDKKKAITEALRVTKPQGILYVAFIMNDAVILDWGLKAGNLTKGMKEGIISNNFHCIGSPELIFEMSTIYEIHDLMNAFPIDKLHMVASDGMTNHFRDFIDGADDELFASWLKYHFCTCEREDLIGFSNHGLYIGRKQ
ncbi:MAG: class I SAM-dependent methyltransferase [Mobilitalea sp.]